MSDDDETIARVARAIYAIANPDFEDEGQSLSDMQFLSDYQGTDYVGMARAALAAAARVKGEA